jgi:hypothetical protein
MRYLVAFLMVFSLKFSIANAMENKPMPVIKKSIIKASFSTKKECHSTVEEPNYDLLNRIQQNIHHYVLTPINFVENNTSLKFISFQKVKIFKRKLNYSYQFIFNFLFPKHTFW